MSPKYFAYAITAMQAAASVAYACDRDIKHAIYWAAAVVLNLSVTFL